MIKISHSHKTECTTHCNSTAMRDYHSPMNLTCHKYVNATTGRISVLAQWVVENTPIMLETIKDYQILTKLMDTRGDIPRLLSVIFNTELAANVSCSTHSNGYHRKNNVLCSVVIVQGSKMAYLVHKMSPDLDENHKIFLRVSFYLSLHLSPSQHGFLSSPSLFFPCSLSLASPLFTLPSPSPTLSVLPFSSLLSLSLLSPLFSLLSPHSLPCSLSPFPLLSLLLSLPPLSYFFPLLALSPFPFLSPSLFSLSTDNSRYQRELQLASDTSLPGMQSKHIPQKTKCSRSKCGQFLCK